MKIKCCVIGLGRIFTKHLISLKEFHFIDLVAACDSNIKKRELYKNLGIPIYDDMVKMCQLHKPDLAIILTPSGYHADHYANIAKYCKNIVIEKPICINSNEIKKIKLYKKKYNNNIFVVKQNRFNKPIIFLYEVLKKNLLGKIFYIGSTIKWHRSNEYYKLDKWRGTYNLDGGVAGNQAAHQLDIILSIVGYPTKINIKYNKVKKFIEYPDTILLNASFKKNIIGSFRFTTATSHDLEGTITILGTHGSIKVSGHQLNKLEYFATKVTKTFFKKKKLNKYSENIKNIYGNSHVKFYGKILKEIKSKIIDKKKLHTAFLTAKLIHEINQKTKSKI